MKKTKQRTRVTAKKKMTRVEQAEARAKQAEARIEQAKTRIEMAETRTENAETRTELAKTRTEQAEIRAELAETRAEQIESALKSAMHTEDFLPQPIRLLKNITPNKIVEGNNLIEKLTERQREVLQLITSGQNTKQIAGLLKISPKTVEYHRMKLMNSLNVHDIPGLVRLALQAGMSPSES